MLSGVLLIQDQFLKSKLGGKVEIGEISNKVKGEIWKGEMLLNLIRIW